MQCIFCKKDSTNSVSIEHIIPESLGNKRFFLRKGIVCDSCNNYFATKIEKPLLELPYFISVRHRNTIQNKKGNIPKDSGILLAPNPAIIDFHIDKNGKSSLILNDSSLMPFLLSNDKFAIIKTVNAEPPIDNSLMSRFLGKVSIEALAQILESEPDGLEEIINKNELDNLRNYVRFGNKIKHWQYHTRKIYEEDQVFYDPQTNQNYCVSHSYKFLQTSDQSFVFVLELMGYEYCIDLAQPTIDRYLNWLTENNHSSPLKTSENFKHFINDLL